MNESTNVLFVPYSAKQIHEHCTVPKLANVFLSSGAEVILVQLDDAVDGIPQECQIIKDVGWKFELAFKHLKGKSFRHLYVWDSDIDPLDFNPNLFSDIMEKNWIDTAHPSLSLDSFQDWSNGYVDNNTLNQQFIGRYMSCLPVMALTFNQRAWNILDSLFDQRYSGELWSYGFAPTGNKAFVDSMPICHTRKVTPRYANDPAYIEMDRNMFDAMKRLGVRHPCGSPSDWMECGKFNRL